MIVILGPTASGKTTLAANLAYHINGEIISADSRQIYKGMDIGTGKDLEEYKVKDKKIKYHLIDILSPAIDYSVYQFKKDFFKCYEKLKNKKKNIILCGGTGLYIESILLNYSIPEIGPNQALRNKLERYDLEVLKNMLKNSNSLVYDKEFHITKRRIIRSIEIGDKKLSLNSQHKNNINQSYVFGIKIGRNQLLKKIQIRLEQRLSDGLVEEVQLLINNGLTIDRLKYFGLEYKFVGEYLFNNIEFNEMKEKLNYAINRFSKRQMTFFRRMEKIGIKIHWLEKDTLEKMIDNVKKKINN